MFDESTPDPFGRLALNNQLTEPFFAMEGCSVVFGGLSAVKNVSFSLGRRELLGLIGPNGAGKTTIFNLATGVYTPSSGRILFNGQQIAGPARLSRLLEKAPEGDGGSRETEDGGGPQIAPVKGQKRERMVSWGRRDIARAGICRTFQNVRLFQGLSVLENVLVACNSRFPQTLGSAMFRSAGFYQAEREARDYARQLLSAFQLEPFSHLLSRNLPYGAQRRLEIARALATKPQLLLLDEPAAGMNPQESAGLMEMIRWVRETFSLAILLIEHDMKVVMGISERILVLENGSLIAEGKPEEIRTNPRVITAYLGEPD